MMHQNFNLKHFKCLFKNMKEISLKLSVISHKLKEDGIVAKTKLTYEFSSVTVNQVNDCTTDDYNFTI